MAMDFTLVNVVSNSDLVQMSQHPVATLLVRNDLISFTRGDLVLEVSDQARNRQFIAVEISRTADLRDTNRARRNDHDVQRLIDAGTVWLVTRAPSDGQCFSVQLSEALGSSRFKGMVMAFFWRPVS